MIDLAFDKAVHQIGVSRDGVLAFGLPDPRKASGLGAMAIRLTLRS